MDKITHINKEEDILEGDIWRYSDERQYLIGNIRRLSSGTLICSITNPDRESDTNLSYAIRYILNYTNSSIQRWIIRDNDSYRRIECSNGCGSFVLEPGEKWRPTCGECKESSASATTATVILDEVLTSDDYDEYDSDDIFRLV